MIDPAAIATQLQALAAAANGTEAVLRRLAELEARVARAEAEMARLRTSDAPLTVRQAAVLLGCTPRNVNQRLKVDQELAECAFKFGDRHRFDRAKLERLKEARSIGKSYARLQALYAVPGAAEVHRQGQPGERRATA